MEVSLEVRLHLDTLRLAEIIKVSCILHNFCIDANDTVEISNKEIADLALDSADDNASTSATSNPVERSAGIRRREMLKDYVNTVLR